MRHGKQDHILLMNVKLKSYFHFIFVIKDTTQKTKDRATKVSLNTEVNSNARER